MYVKVAIPTHTATDNHPERPIRWLCGLRWLHFRTPVHPAPTPATIGNQVSHKMSAEQKKQAKKSESVQLQIENPLTTSVSVMRGGYTEKKR